jgi:hypothetical protein
VLLPKYVQSKERFKEIQSAGPINPRFFISDCSPSCVPMVSISLQFSCCAERYALSFLEGRQNRNENSGRGDDGRVESIVVCKVALSLVYTGEWEGVLSIKRRELTASRADPALYCPQARVFGRPAAHHCVGCLEFVIDHLVGDLCEFL